MNLNLPAKRYIHPALEELKAAVKPFRLVSKKTGMKLSEYKGSTLNIIPFEDYYLLDTITVDEVIVQSTKNPQIKKTITTFRDYLGNITERIIENSTPGSKLRNRLYKKDCCNMREQERFFTKSVVQEYTMPKSKIQEYKQRLSGIANSAEIKDIYWNQEFTITNILETNRQKLQKFLTTIKTIFTGEKNLHLHSIKESAPINAVNGKMKIAKNAQTKFLEMATSQKDDGEIMIKSLSKSPQVSDSVLNDEYLPFRLYEATDVRVPITKYCIKKNNLDDVGINIIPNYDFEGISDATFENLRGEIAFSSSTQLKKWTQKTDYVKNAAHEAEHARQHSLIGQRIGDRMFKGSYMNRCFEKKGPIRDIETYAETTEYMNDMFALQQFNFGNPEVFQKYSYLYYNSSFEKGAIKAGEMAKQHYIAQGQNFAREFAHIPHKWML